MKNAPDVYLQDGERQRLEKMISTGIERARVLTRARIVLLAADRSAGRQRGGPGQIHSTLNLDIAAMLHISPRTVSRTCQRYIREGLEGALYDKGRSGRPREITGDVEAKLTMLACSAPPDGHAHWTLQLLADKMIELHYIDHISDVAVMHVLKKTNCALGRSRAGVSRR